MIIHKNCTTNEWSASSCNCHIPIKLHHQNIQHVDYLKFMQTSRYSILYRFCKSHVTGLLSKVGNALLSIESRSVSQKRCTHLDIELVLVGGAHEPPEAIRLLCSHSQHLKPCHKNTHYRSTRPEALPQEHTLQVYET